MTALQKGAQGNCGLADLRKSVTYRINTDSSALTAQIIGRTCHLLGHLHILGVWQMTVEASARLASLKGVQFKDTRN